MDDTTAARLEAIEAALAKLTDLVAPMAAAWAKFGPQLEARFANPVARWKGRLQ